MALRHAFRFIGRQFMGFFSDVRQDLLPIEEREPDRVVVALSMACENLIDEDEHKELNDFIRRGEPEIGFEGLMISLMRADVLPADFDLAIWRRVAAAYKTVDRATLDEHVWQKFEAWANQKSAKSDSTS